MAEATTTACLYGCGTIVDLSEPGAQLEVSRAFVERREGGGAHGIRLAKFTGRGACKSCVDKEAAGIGAGQGALEL